MSRCFPFPPPGYERKHRPEDFDLLKEEKRKEKKKHKKEKKDKERNKDKSKKEKDGGDEKHREKKDRKGKDKSKKEKKRGKKKEKEDHAKDKEKSSISEESTVAAESEGKLHPEGHHSKNQINLPNEGKFSGPLFQGQKGNEESKFVLELDRRIREERGQGSQLPERLVFEGKKDQDIVAVRSSSSGLLSEENGDNKNKRVDSKIDPHELRNEFSGNAKVQNLIPTAKSKLEEIPRPANEQNGWRLEDKHKYKETGDIKQVDKKKDGDKESHGKRKDREKDKKKNDKSKRKKENNKDEQDKLKDDGMNNLGGFTGNKSSDLLMESNSNAVNEGNIRKRKDMGANGFLHDSEIRPHKMQKPAPHHSTENGRKLEPFPTPSKPSHDKHALPNNDHKERLMNGVIEIPKPSQPKANIPSAPAPMVSDKIAEPSSKIPQSNSNLSIKARKVPKIEDPIAEASSSRRPRPPHPDTKYLAEVLTVPKMTADLSQNDDQDWLFSKKAPIKPKTGSLGPNEDLRVWSEAVHIESADVIALPYVIPY